VGNAIMERRSNFLAPNKFFHQFMGSFGSHFCQVCRFVYPKLKKTDFFPAENSSFVFEKIKILIVFQEYF